MVSGITAFDNWISSMSSSQVIVTNRLGTYLIFLDFTFTLSDSVVFFFCAALTGVFLSFNWVIGPRILPLEFLKFLFPNIVSKFPFHTCCVCASYVAQLQCDAPKASRGVSSTAKVTIFTNISRLVLEVKPSTFLAFGIAFCGTRN